MRFVINLLLCAQGVLLGVAICNAAWKGADIGSVFIQLSVAFFCAWNTRSYGLQSHYRKEEVK